MPEAEAPSTLRRNPEQLRAWALAAYAEGKPSRDVLTEIYGVDLPLEAYVFQRSYPRDNELPIDRFFHPWALLEMTSPSYAAEQIDDHYAKLEIDEFTANPDFLPLMSLQAGEAVHDGYVIGYSIEQLRRGSTSILAHLAESGDGGKELKPLGDSLLGVLHEWMTDYHRMEKAQYEAPENRRTASDWNLKHAAQWLKAIEKLQRKVLAAGSIPST